jgi:hypothetical protein
MLEDKEREVFSINVTWPQGQRDKWEALVAEEERKEIELYEAKMRLIAEKKEVDRMRRESRSGLNNALSNVISLKKSLPDLSSISNTPIKALKEADPNLKGGKRAHSAQSGNLKTSTSKATFLEALPWRKSWAHETER